MIIMAPAIADGQDGIGLQRLRDVEAMLQNADQQTGNNIDAGDKDSGHGVALRKAARSVHSAEKFGLGCQFFTAAARLAFVDQAGVQIGIDRHLFAGQRIESESGRDFRNADRAVVDHNILDRDQNKEDNGPDDVVPAHHEVAESLNHVARGRGAGVAVEQDQTSRRHVERQPE